VILSFSGGGGGGSLPVFTRLRFGLPDMRWGLLSRIFSNSLWERRWPMMFSI
jgi:hypothetical protein